MKKSNCRIKPLTATGMEPFKKGAHCFEPEFEYDWDRVKRMRKEKHPLIFGGKNKRIVLQPSRHCKTNLVDAPTTGTRELAIRKFHLPAEKEEY